MTIATSHNAPQVAIINEDMARRFWPDQNPIGQQIRSGAGPRPRVATIVGIAANVRPPQQLEFVPQIYTSYLQQSEPNITLIVPIGCRHANRAGLDQASACGRSFRRSRCTTFSR